MEDKKEIGNVQINLATDHGVIYATQNNENNFPEKDNRIEEKCHEYAERYEEELPPMGDDSISVSLRQLYIEPEYSLLYPYESKKEGVVFSYLKEFLHSEKKKKKKILFVEGDAGIGKTSLVSKIAYHYEYPNEESELGNDFFTGTRLICVQLRDMLEISQTLNIEHPWEDIFQYLNIAKEERKEESKKKSVLILDGFDELCMLESIQEDNKGQYFKNLSRELNVGWICWKVIVTSRPNYINWESFNGKLEDCIEVIQLQHFSIEKRRQWINKAKAVGIKISQEVEEGITAFNRRELEAIIGVPWTLYLVAKKHIVIGSGVNLWYIYYLIFKKENIERNFEMDAVHKTEPLKEYLYQITEKIAFWMYENKCFDINSAKIDELINEVNISKDIQKKWYKDTSIPVKNKKEIHKLLKDTYVLHTYYRKSDNKGGLAFYHNYIQDFFLCEQIFSKLDKSYEQLKMLKTPYEQLDCLITCYDYLLYAGYLNENTVRFIQARIQHECKTNEKSTWVEHEQKHSMFIQAFKDMLWYGIGKPDFLRRIKRPISQITEMIFYNCWRIYGWFYQTNNQSILNLFREGKEIFILPIKSILEILSKNVPLNGIELEKVDLSKINLSEANLNEANLNGADLRGTNLKEANLNGVDLRRTNLSGATLIRADLIKADLREADLGRANLGGADLREANLRETNLLGTDLKEVNLIRADLRRANLSKANLGGADLSEADLREANLERTDLREVNLMKANLNKANLSGANLRRANLSKANLGETDLDGTDLREANLNRGNLRRANLSKANLGEADLDETDLREANLSGADLKGVSLNKVTLSRTNLRGANLEGVRLNQFDLNSVDVIETLSKANFRDANWCGVTSEQIKKILSAQYKYDRG